MKPAARRFGTALVVSVASVAAAATVAAPAARPGAGRYTAELCVTTLPKPPSCGPTQAELHADGTLRLRVDDIVYNMTLHSSQVEVIVLHNVVQIDEFTVPYEWVGNTLQFADDDRHSRYAIRFASGKR